MTRKPPWFGGIGLPWRSTISATTPGKGRVAEKRERGGAGLGWSRSGQRCNQNRARFGLPPGIDDRAALAADHLVIPDPGLGIDRLADGAE